MAEFSMLDGLGSIQGYVDRAKELGQPALAITDHGTMCGVPAFYHACRKAEIEPIIGCEFYFVEDASFRPGKGEPAQERHHVVLLARGYEGYQVLAELSTESHRNFYYKPLVDTAMVEALDQDAQHLVCLSGCAASIISHTVRAESFRAACQEVEWWRDAFPHFYIELQNHETDFDAELNAGLMKVAQKYKLPMVITNDPHYVHEEEAVFHDRLLAIQTASDVDDPNRFRFDGSGYHLKSRVEIKRAFRAYDPDLVSKAMANTARIAKLCHTRIPQWEKRTWHIPKFPDVDDAYKELKRLTYKGLRERGWIDVPEYRNRAVSELKAIKQVGIADFLLITLDSIQWAVEQDIPVGPGRGSVCGTLVGYLIGLHKIDPVRYELMFERFLNPARPRMPDIDTDFGPTKRHLLFEYVSDKYGPENVVHVAAYQNMKVKAAFRSLAKSYGVSFPETNRLAKFLPDVLPDEDQGEEWTEDFQKEITAKYPELHSVLVRLSGLKRAVSAHPAGVIIGDPDDHIRKLVPEMFLPSSKRMCGQYDLDAAEEMGLMKQDFLSLRTLETIQETVRLIQESTGEELDPDSWVPDEEPDDDKVYQMLSEGHTAGVFQMEGPTNQRGIKAVGCKEFEDIVSTTSLYRTGAISAGFPKMFIANRRAGSTDDIEYIHPSLKPILDRTWGVVLYQEQVMEMGQMLAGFDMEQVDDIKEAIKHKRSTLMQSMKPLFIKGCRKHAGMSSAVAAKVWHMIEGYSGYGYNRSHAVAYTFISYQTARLKALWPTEFIVALLRTVSDKDKRNNYLQEAVRLGIKVVPVDINRSDLYAVPDEGAIRFGFVDLAGIGPKQAQKILEGRPKKGYRRTEQVEEAARNKGVMAVLADSGSLASLGLEGSPERQEELLNWQFRDTMKPWRKRYWQDLLKPEDRDPDNDMVVLIGEIVAYGHSGKTKDGKGYATWVIRWAPNQQWHVRLWSETEKCWAYPKGTVVRIVGKWKDQYENVSVGNPKAIKRLKL